MHLQPAALDGKRKPGLVFGRAGAVLSQEKGQLIFSIWMRPSCTGSTALAISSSLRAAFSGSANGGSVAYFTGWAQRSCAPRSHVRLVNVLADAGNIDGSAAEALRSVDRNPRICAASLSL